MINRLVVLQPCYIPWIGYFEQICKSNIFVFFDDVQYERKSWQCRNNIKEFISEEKVRITVPVIKQPLRTKIMDVIINNEREWVIEHLETVKKNYYKTPYFKDFFHVLKTIYDEKFDRLADLNIKLILEISKYIGISSVKFYRSSELKLMPYESSTDHLLKICNYFGASHYLTGDSARNYLDEDLFSKNNIKLEYQNYSHPVYKQQGSKFVPFMSVIDLIFNEGPNSLEILSNKKYEGRIL